MNEQEAYSALTQAVEAAGMTQSAAEYHGALCGTLCARLPAKVDVLAVLDGADPQASPVALAALRDATVSALSEHDGDIRLVLPPDDVPLAARAAALGEWCEGFLFGLASAGTLELKRASPEVREVVEDFTQFTRAGFDEGGDAEIEESAYAELVEYVRVGLQLVFLELAPVMRRKADNPAGNPAVH